VGPEIENFLGPKMGTSVASDILAQKSRDFRAHHFKRPEKWKRDKREKRDFRAHSAMVCNKRLRSLRGRIKGVDG
jgi:hypothetical protein